MVLSSVWQWVQGAGWSTKHMEYEPQYFPNENDHGRIYNSLTMGGDGSAPEGGGRAGHLYSRLFSSEVVEMTDEWIWSRQLSYGVENDLSNPT